MLSAEKLVNARCSYTYTYSLGITVSFRKLHLLHLAEYTDASDYLLWMLSPYLTLLVLFWFDSFRYLEHSAETTVNKHCFIVKLQDFWTTTEPVNIYTNVTVLITGDPFNIESIIIHTSKMFFDIA